MVEGGRVAAMGEAAEGAEVDDADQGVFGDEAEHFLVEDVVVSLQHM